MRRYKYYVLGNQCELEKSTKKDFKYFYDNFCKKVMDAKGKVYDKADLKFNLVENIYNPFGVLIAEKK